MMIILFFDGDFGNVTISSKKVVILIIDLNNINPNGVNFDEDDPEAITHVRLVAWGNKLKPRKALL